MEIIRRVHTMREIVRNARREGEKIGFVPTMGYLHEGHLNLIRRIKELSDLVVVSIFVNPTQFGPGEDFNKYPRDLARDADLCVREGVDYILYPPAAEVYPPNSCTFVEVEGLSDVLEGKSRPGHFRGVTTVVTKLFHVVQPTVAAFGQKDFQQALIVQRMVKDLLMDVEILVLPTVRDDDGLALSSRNRYLNPEEREAARAIPGAREAARKVVADGERGPERVVGAARQVLEAQPLLKTDYVELVDTRFLQPVERLEGETLLALAVYAGPTRLIDNEILRV